MQFWQSLKFTSTEDLLELAQTIETQTPFHGVFVGDHGLYPETMSSSYAYTADGKVTWPSETHWPDIGVAFGAMAAATKYLHFATSIMVLPLRHPIDVARTMATLSVVSDNRVVLGSGVGWLEDEFKALGIDFRTRGKRYDEMIDVMRLLWSGEMVEYHGQFFDFPRSLLRPKPIGRIPLYIGGDSAVALRRAALRGDGWIASNTSPEVISHTLADMRRALREAGRDKEPFQYVVALRKDLDLIKQLRDLGATTIFNLSLPEDVAGRRTAREKLDSIRRYADEIIAKM